MPAPTGSNHKNYSPQNVLNANSAFITSIKFSGICASDATISVFKHAIRPCAVQKMKFYLSVKYIQTYLLDEVSFLRISYDQVPSYNATDTIEHTGSKN